MVYGGYDGQHKVVLGLSDGDVRSGRDVGSTLNCVYWLIFTASAAETVNGSCNLTLVHAGYFYRLKKRITHSIQYYCMLLEQFLLLYYLLKKKNSIVVSFKFHQILQFRFSR